MRVRQIGMSCLICLGCHGIAGVGPAQPAVWGTLSSVPMETGTLESVPHKPAEVPSHLLLAAACIEKGDDAQACHHLGLFLADHPEHRNARFYHAELLLKLGRHRQAAGQFELAIRYEQGAPEPDVKHLVHCHTQLVRIGEELDDGYLAHLHRGIGMLLLARQRTQIDEPSAELSTESLLCKATAELTRAHSLRPHAVRPCWYLHVAWRQLAQHGVARRWLAEAQRHPVLADLTPAESRDLHLAGRAW